MSTVEERRRALLKMCGWYPANYEGEVTEVYKPYVETHKRMTELSIVVLPDEPAPKPQTIHVNQQFADGFDPDRIAKSFAEAVEKENPATRKLIRQAEQRTFQAVIGWLERAGKKKAVKLLREFYVGPGCGDPNIR